MEDKPEKITAHESSDAGVCLTSKLLAVGVTSTKDASPARPRQVMCITDRAGGHRLLLPILLLYYSGP